MPKYYTLSRAYSDEEDFSAASPLSMTVHAPEGEHTDSGILNERGEPLYRRTMHPIGFLAEHD